MGAKIRNKPKPRYTYINACGVPDTRRCSGRYISFTVYIITYVITGTAMEVRLCIYVYGLYLHLTVINLLVIQGGDE